MMVVCLILLAALSAAAAQSLPGCLPKCGDVEIPYPFGVDEKSGTGKSCFLEKAFRVSCDQNSKLKSGNVEISNISLLQGQMDMSMFVSWRCFNESGGVVGGNETTLRTASFTISSSENKFFTVGCDTYGYLNSFQYNRSYATGCLTKCDGVPNEENNKTCSGIGCCQVDIPLGMRNISMEAYTFNKTPKVSDFNNCSYAFVAKRDWFKYSNDFLKHRRFDTAPLVVDWAVRAVSNKTCKSAQSKPDYACTSNTNCEDTDHGFGYRCKCKSGFDGNPYHPDGCHDVDECKEPSQSTRRHNCTSDENCRNKDGSFECYCPSGYSGNGTREGGCHANSPLTKILIGACAGLIAVFVSVSWLFLLYQKRKLIRLKEKFFRQNGGFILLQQLSVKEGSSSSQTAKIFTAEELKKATNDYHESLIIGRGGFGTVYKGFLTDNTIVAIKKSKLVDQSQTDQFINEVLVLSQINHRNVVKLLGCCLETEVPLLVYEFVNNGTLFDHIHNKSKASNVSWETHLRIAAEAAGALSYLHSEASIPIIHRDVKTSNILLDDTYTAKVSDFGASRLVPLDQTELATMVQGTLGYLDPEYMLTNQLTEKSDVYSFGVVLVELLTGKKALSFDKPEEERSLAMHFLSSLKQGRLFEVLEVGIVNDENKQMLKEVGVLAARCLRVKGEERPSMKEVGMELEGILKMTGKPSLVNKDLSLEENQSLLGETSGISECGDSINYGNTGWDSITDQVLIVLDDGR